MNKEFIPYKQALILKELGFDKPCFAMWTKGLSEFESSNISPPRIFSSKFKLDDVQSCISYINNQNHFGIAAPLYQQAFRWFREKYNLESWVYKSRDGAYFYSILREDRYLNPSHQYSTYEEAELECLKKLIELCQNK